MRDVHTFLQTVLYLLTISLTTCEYIIVQFHDNNNIGAFNHLIINKKSGKLYVGAVNRLYQLAPDFTEEISIVTGPKKDNPNCIINSCEKRKDMDSYNKLLLVDYQNDRLISCTSPYHGLCEKRKLSDITQTDRSLNLPMVANDATSSTVGFIAPGAVLNNGSPLRNALYIAVTWTNVGMKGYRDLIPAYCVRNLTNFKIYYKGVGVWSKIQIESQQRGTFPVHYVYGFPSDGFSFMLSVQRADISSTNYISKIIRVCENDMRFYSYTELQLTCTHSGVDYDLLQAATVQKPGSLLAQSLGINVTDNVLFAVFSIGHPNSAKPTASSALCIYSLQYIQKKFHQNIIDCFNGVGYLGPDHFMSRSKCINSKISLNDPYCGEHDINTPIAGHLPVKSEAVLGFKGQTPLASIAVTTTHIYTVAFVGLKTGHLRKVFMKTKNEVQEYEVLTVDEGSAVNADMVFDLPQSHIYVMTERKVSKLRVQDCSKYKSCLTCLGASDPYCGWCSFENRCSMRSKCPSSEVDLRWMPFDSDRCTTITRIEPHQVQRKTNTKTTLNLVIQSLPSTRGVYICMFSKGKFNFDVIAKTTETGVQCDTPLHDTIPDFPPNQDHVVLRLSVWMEDKEFVATNFTFFDCATYPSCNECTVSRFPCTWCIRNHMCTHVTEDCRADNLVTGRAVTGVTTRPGPQYCPMFNNTKTEIHVTSGKSESIQVTAVNLLAYQRDLQCFFNVRDGRQVNAKVRRDTIVCDSVQFDYDGNAPFKNVAFQILWGNNYPIDNPYDIHVKMYKCSAMASSCGLCLTITSSYECGWCERASGYSVCAIRNQCADGKWLNRLSICPNPLITRFYPLKGPKSGGTNLTIEGINLGKDKTDIMDGVMIAGTRCVVYGDAYITASRILCQTQPTEMELAGNVNVTVAGQYIALSQVIFKFIEPRVIGVEPPVGPRGGGTKVTVFGVDLDAGSSHEIYLGKHPCVVDEGTITSASLECVTSYSDTIGHQSIRLVIDNFDTMFGVRYTYLENPRFKAQVKGVSRSSIISGGLVKTFTGTNLNITRKPRLIFWYKDVPYTSDCNKLNSTNLICSTPMLSPLANPNYPLEVSFGFEMDNVTEVLNLTRTHGKTFQVMPDPVMEKFQDNMRVQKPDKLEIMGQYLHAVRLDLTVDIGEGRCDDVEVSGNGDKLQCRLPLVEPPALDNHPHPRVIVSAGNWSMVVGRLQYQTPPLLTSTIKIGIGVGAAVVVLVVIIICVFVVMYRLKSREKDTMMKKYHSQMDQLSMKVAKECKEAFAELQMNITTELASDLSGTITVPYWDYHQFAMNVLFANDPNHPVMKKLEVDIHLRNNIEQGLQQLFRLGNNKTFLLIFLRTLESNSKFGMRDRVNVASLVCLAYHSRLEYITDILKTLLAELIEKCVERKENPKILLRRTESIAEKMLTNWFTFLLYKFLKEVSGEPLFMLYQAIKQQVAKGPIDAVSGEARYALSEDKLIRQQIDYRPMTLNVVDVDTQYGQQQYHSVKVLDCDSITQVKEKILDSLYKNTTPSSRPLTDELDLVLYDHTTEWHQGMGRKLILQDEDNTSKIEGDYKRINVLAHYKVPDQALVALVSRQPSLYNLSLISEKSAKFLYGGEHLPLYSKSPSLGRTGSQNQAIYAEIDNNKKLYHLVKPQDNDPHREGDRGSKMVSEVYLTRLLKTKGTLQHFVDDLIERIFSTAHGVHALPLAIKYLFDFLDEQAIHHNIQDPEVVHSWKSNSLPLRFWVNVIKNPDFVFDINKSNIVDSCLSVVAQTFMDSCSMAENRLGINSPSSKLLYAQEIPRYKKWVERYYQDIGQMPAISDQDMNAMLSDESRNHCQEFNTTAALHELYKYILHYNTELTEALECDEFARKYRLSAKLEQVHAAMAGEEASC